MSEVELGGNAYRTGKLTPIKQLHLARRLAPALAALGTAAREALDAGKADVADDDLGPLLAVFGPVAQVLAQMSDADVEYITNTCLQVCMRKQDGKWFAISNGGPKLMYEDIDMSVMLQLTLACIKENLGNFFPEPPAQTSQAALPKSAT